MHDGEVFLFGVIVIKIKLLNSCGFCVSVQGKKEVYQHFITYCFFITLFISASQKYLNGELEDGTETAAFQRSFEATGFYEDGELYTFKTEKNPKTEDLTPGKDPTLAIVLPIVFVIIIAVVVVGIFIYRRRQNLFESDEDEGMPMNETSRGGKASSKRNRMSGIGKLDWNHSSHF